MTDTLPPDAAAGTSPAGPPPQRGGTARRRGRRWRARTLRGALGVTLLGALVPGLGLVVGRRWWGYAVLLAALGGAGYLVWSFRDLDSLVALASDAQRLRAGAWLIAAMLGVWAITVVATYLLVRPRPLGWWRGGLGALAVAGLCVALASPLAVASRYATVQAGLVTDVFEDNATATVPVDVTEHDPWGGRERVNVLLLGGDGDVGRDGVRTDTLILVSIDTATGDTVMFSLPRNMMRAQFPPGSPLHGLYPEGFTGYGDPAAWMLNAVYGQVPLLHPGVLGTSTNEGADAVKQAIAGTLGVPVDYYVLVNLQGFRQIVDAIGGVTVNINEPIAIHGNTDLGIPPVGYLQPGPNQRLDGYEALWFTRGRWGSDDYERMLRQRCMVDALIREAHPWNLLRRYQALVAAGKEIVRTDVPARLLPAFVDLALQVKEAEVRSVAFVSSERFNPAYPDFEWVRATVRKALEAPGERTGQAGSPPSRDPSPGVTPAPTPPGEPVDSDDPGTAVDVSDSCAYRPVS